MSDGVVMIRIQQRRGQEGGGCQLHGKADLQTSWARFKRQTLLVAEPNANNEKKTFCSCTLGSTHVKFDV